MLRSIRSDNPVGAMRRRIVNELLAELRVLDRKGKAINAELDTMLDDDGTCLTDIDGIGRVAAATIIAIVGDVRRLPTAAHFASFTGTAPVAASSGEVVRYRLNLGGHRQMNKCCTRPRRSRPACHAAKVVTTSPDVSPRARPAPKRPAR